MNTLVLFLTSGESFSFSPFSMMLAIGLLYTPCIMLRIGSHFMPRASLDHNLPICASCTAGMTGACHHA
jgi:hypothetical protein